VSAPNRWAFAVLDRLVDANILIAAAGEPNLRQYMPRADLPVVHNSAVVEDMAQSSAVHEPPVVLFIGELLERKGVIVLLDALDLLAARGVTDLDVRIIGDNRPGLDPLKDDMVAAITARGRAEDMTGPVDRAEVYRHLAEADLYVFPTETEGQPFTVIEALSAGVPIVATDIQAISNMIEDGPNGRLVGVGDAAGFADAMQSLLGDPDERRAISAANRKLAMDRFNRDVFRDAIAALYRRSGNADRRRHRRRDRRDPAVTNARP
jgi:glycosyltransferase involved in cell wall biosynthesis